MWRQWIEKIIDSNKPEMKQRLKSILSVTASGSHDKVPYGETDLDPITDIKSLLFTLKISLIKSKMMETLTSKKFVMHEIKDTP
jgi:hypothetical protein